MRIAHLSDLHFGAIEAGQPEAIISTLEHMRPDLTVISGDLTQRGRRSEFSEAKAFFAKISSPLISVPGNHDMPHGLRLWSRFRKTFQAYQDLISKTLEPVWCQMDTVVVGLNSAVPGGWYLDWDRGRIKARQLIALRQHLKSAPPDWLRVAVVHHPPAAPPGGSRRHLLDNRTALFGALNDACVDLILSGHFHLSYAVPIPLPGPTIRSCVLSVTSTATSSRRKGEPNGFHIIDTAPNTIMVAAMSWDGAAYHCRREWSFTRAQGRDWREARIVSTIE